MFEITSIDELGCKISLWGSGGRDARLSFTCASLDVTADRDAISAFCDTLRFRLGADLELSIERDRDKVDVSGMVRLPIVFRSRRKDHILAFVRDTYRETLQPLIRTRTSSYLGRLIWDGAQSGWTTSVTIHGEQVPVTIETWSDKDITPIVDGAEELIKNWDSWYPRITDAMTQDLHGIYNDNWRTDGRPKLDSVQFLERLAISSISCDESGWRSVYFTQDELFTDHIIDVRISPDNELQAVLAG
ncbi:hypothetical protein CA13_65570 [Planctomycetes bacterium CA13]|uniref:DUF2262 domain-containing protein n=1 Tax=Novipirellula herctigrandis TaxID=2527986 RepID=A0A5C5ZD41_9BACT|nr:hypothetical protein CA13_65570 [Planctomycetes bacterium CA13]